MAWRWAAAAALVATLLGGYWNWRRTSPAGELLTQSGEPFVSLHGAESGARLELADGSWLAAAPGALVRAVASSSQEFSVLLERGTLEVRVVPRGPRKWSVESKWARIEVVGTRFVLQRSEMGLLVRVSEGVVVVRAARLPEGIQRVSAGQELFVGERPEPHLAAPPAPPEQAAASPAEGTDAHEPSPAPGEAAPLPPSAAALLELADAARASGDHPRATRVLLRLLREFPDSEQAPWARYGLGVAQLQEGRVQEARRTFAALAAARPPQSLWQDTLLRQVELESRLGDAERARALAAEYRARFPSGRHLARIAALTTPLPAASQP